MQHTRTALALFVALAAAGCSGLRLEHPLRLHPDDWLTLGGSAARVHSAQQSIVAPLTKEWEYDVTGGIGSGTPLAADSIIFVGNLRGELYALHASTGTRIGWIRLGESIEGSPIIDGNLLVAAASNTRESLVAYSLTEGKTQWKQECGDLQTSPLLLGHLLYAGSMEGKLSCVDRLTGSPIWKYEIPDNTKMKGIRSSPAGEGSTVVFGCDDGFIRALSAERGIEQWKMQTGASVVAPAVIRNGMVLAANLNGTVLALSLSSGTPRWRYEAGSPIYGYVATTDSVAVVGTLGGRLLALKISDGSLLWSTAMGGPIGASVLIAGSTIYAGTLHKMLCALRLSDGAITWSTPVEGRIKTPPIAVGKRVIVATDERLVLSFREGTP